MENVNDVAATMPRPFPMNGGDGPHSYLKNSGFQRRALDVSRTMIQEAIAEKLDVKALISNSFRLADLGCSVGPNTFTAVQHILEAVERKYLDQGLKSEIPEFLVFFNDHVGNDFNTLFAFLPSERRYFACGIPGSFYGRLFPESSMHFMHSSHALQWMSKVPEELLDKNSPAWNRGRIHYGSAPDEVKNAYRTQFERDIEMFLSARAKELVVGGMMVLLMPGFPTGMPISHIPISILFNHMGSILMDMTREGLISEAQVDSFNLPIHVASPEQMTELVERNGSLIIEGMELVDPRSQLGGPRDGKAYAQHLRAGLEGIFAQHFGSGIIDELFGRLSKKVIESSHQLESGSKQGTVLMVVLRRK